MSQSRQYEHNCNSCQFLGIYTYEAPMGDGSTIKMSVDLYYCGAHEAFSRIDDESVIARFSSDPQDYSLMPMILVERGQVQLRGLVEAWRRINEPHEYSLPPPELNNFSIGQLWEAQIDDLRAGRVRAGDRVLITDLEVIDSSVPCIYITFHALTGKIYTWHARYFEGIFKYVDS